MNSHFVSGNIVVVVFLSFFISLYSSAVLYKEGQFNAKLSMGNYRQNFVLHSGIREAAEAG